MKGRFALIVPALALVVASCDEPVRPNFNSPTVEESGKDPSSLQLLATGLLSQFRGNVTTYALSLGILGRESFNYTPTEGRNTTHYLNGLNGALDPSGFAAGNWTSTYNNTRNIFNFLEVVAAAPLTQAQKDASEGFAKTLEATELHWVLRTRDSIGIVVETRADPKELAPFVSRDSAYRFISARLDEADADLVAAGATAFPFVLTSGFAGFNTPATYRQLNRGIAARVLVERARLGCATCYASALTALGNSFISVSAAALNNGPFHTYSTSTGDVANGLFFSTTSDIVAHPSIQADAQLKGDGTRDNRLLAKVDTATPTKQPSPDITQGIPTSVRFRMYPDRNAGVKIMRNEELILLRAEARWFTGDRVNALVDLNFIRTSSGGLPASTLTIASTDAEFVTELLVQRRYSLLFEGFRWVDLRQFGRLTDLPLDRAHHIRAKVQPVPQGECLIRVNETTPAMRGPGCP